MSMQPSTPREIRRSRRRLGAVVAISSALLLAGLDVAAPSVAVPSASAVGGGVLFGLAALVPLLTATGAVAARRSAWPDLWLVTGCLLIVGMAPFGLGAETVLVGALVVAGQTAPTLDRRWYELSFGAGLVVAALGVGSALYTQIDGHVSVMVAVAGAMTVGTGVSLVTAAVPASGDHVADASSIRPLGDRTESYRSRVANWLLATDESHAANWTHWKDAIAARVRPEGALLVAYSLVVCVLHFSGLAYGLYTRYVWWDLMTHTLSGAGVAAWLSLLGPPVLRRRRRLLVSLPALVFLTGAGFEVYEFLFRGFYDAWSVDYYLKDTLVDLGCNLTGAVTFGLVLSGWRS
jgi:hypothetical protein